MIPLEENDISIPISLSRPRKTFFSHKIEPQNHSVLILNESQVQVTSENHVSMFLDSKMRFGEHLTILPVKFNKSIEPLTKLKTSTNKITSYYLQIVHKSYFFLW